jgi:hypothetical protein
MPVSMVVGYYYNRYYNHTAIRPCGGFMNVENLIERLKKIKNPGSVVSLIQVGDEYYHIKDVKLTVTSDSLVLVADTPEEKIGDDKAKSGYSKVVGILVEGNYRKMILECGCRITRHSSQLAISGTPKSMKCRGDHQ